MSDFWADLQAWTQAQFERLVRINLRRRKQWSADDINRLLRDRVAKRLTIKLGKRVPPEFLRSNGRWPPDLPPIPCEMLSGWLAYHYGPDTTGLEWLYERQESGDIDGPISDPAFNGVRFGQSRCNENLTGTDGMIANKGMCYSGRMRELVQALGGKTQQIPYNYQWCETHGVYINQITGAWWIIAISQTDGVLAVPAVWCHTYTEEEQLALGVTIPGIPSAAVPGGIGTRSLGDASEAYAGGTAIYSEHGWAFSYTGHHAALISITWPTEYIVSSLWMMEIVADENGDPASVNLEKLEYDTMYWSQDFAPKFPYFTEYGPTLLTLDMHYDLEGAPTPTDIHPPIDVFFTPISETPAIVRYHVDPEGETETMPSTWPSDAIAACTDLILLNHPDGNYYQAAFDRQVLATVAYEMDSIGRPEAAQDQYIETTSGHIIDTFTTVTGGWGGYIGSDAVDRRVFPETRSGEGRWSDGGSDHFVRRETYFKPLFDREMGGLYRKRYIGRSRGAGQKATHNAIFGGGYYYRAVGTSVNICGAGVDTVSKPSENADCSVAEFTTWPVTRLLAYPTGFRLDGWNLYKYEPYPNTCNYRWFMQGCVTENGLAGCHTVSVGAYSNQAVDQKTDTWLWNNAKLRWEHVYDVDEYEFYDAMSDYVSDPSMGVLLFSAYLDAFTGDGVTQKKLNLISGEEMYQIGAVTAYPVTDGDRNVYDGWFGIPFPPP